MKLNVRQRSQAALKSLKHVNQIWTIHGTFWGPTFSTTSDSHSFYCLFVVRTSRKTTRPTSCIVFETSVCSGTRQIFSVGSGSVLLFKKSIKNSHFCADWHRAPREVKKLALLGSLPPRKKTQKSVLSKTSTLVQKFNFEAKVVFRSVWSL